LGKFDGGAELDAPTGLIVVMSFLTSGQSRYEREQASPRDMRRARTGVALVTSLLLHALVTLNWGPAAQPPAPEARNGEAVIVFLPTSAPPIRRPRVVVVGPEATGHGGSPRGRAPESAGPRGARRERLSPTNPSTPTELSPSTLADHALPDTPVDVVAPVANPEPSTSESPVTTIAADPDRTFDDLVQAQTLWLAVGRGEGRGGFGRSGGRPGFALSLDVSGRRVAGSRVVAAPVVLEQRRIACELPTGRLRAVVRLLVLRDGTGAAPRMLESSGHRSFDECAVRYAQGLRFAPGVDGAGRPLDVWVHVGITPAVGSQPL
jgi:outer membrane biosynthesis protein TonB